MSDNELAVFLPGNRSSFEPGSRLDVTVLWAFAKAPVSIEVRLCWVTRGKGTEDGGVVATVPLASPSAAGEQVCSLALPASPWSFSGTLISLVWAVEAVARGPDQTATCEFVMAPGGQEIRLDAQEAR